MKRPLKTPKIASGRRFFESECEAHHEVDPAFVVRRDRVDRAVKRLAFEPILLKYLDDLVALDFGNLFDLLTLAALFLEVVVVVRARGEITAEPH